MLSYILYIEFILELQISKIWRSTLYIISIRNKDQSEYKCTTHTVIKFVKWNGNCFTLKEHLNANALKDHVLFFFTVLQQYIYAIQIVL